MNSEEDKSNDLEFFLAEKGPFLVVSFIGLISKSTAAVMEKCRVDTLNTQAQSVVLSLHDVTDIELTGIPPFVQFQQAIRKKPAELCLCFIRPDLIKFLLNRGAVREEEITANLKVALESLKRTIKRQRR